MVKPIIRLQLQLCHCITLSLNILVIHVIRSQQQKLRSELMSLRLHMQLVITLDTMWLALGLNLKE